MNLFRVPFQLNHYRGGLFELIKYKHTQFVPKHDPVKQKDIEKLENFLEDKHNLLVLTGAGVSTESGIPDYRSEGVGMYARTNNRPVQYMDFLSSQKVRQRYWARNFVAWPKFSSIQPNVTHYALARFERDGHLKNLITQNVDRLHTKAGSKNVVELHGSGSDVICLSSSCDYKISRHDFQLILNSLNATMVDRSDLIRPDGDIEIPQPYIDSFQIPPCPNCGGILKPHIVFFGDSIPSDRVQKVAEFVCASDGLLILGSTLQVYSSYRILLHSYDLSIPIAIVNIGPVRGQEKADIKISARCGDVIPKMFAK